ncbi:MAG TPA: adenylate/guanylate cyclase domain-containing protein [Caldimonas sp.]|jgi:class 3 adenylate cyclase|nr:adenylate/guanylate cyclase domain-containing protein [Caldimonas sp.]HEX4233795.1 adenylate/guanylate cyclase domain-containing protein [Caldimonas sp.]
MTELSTLSMTEIIRLQNQLQNELRRRFERSLLMAFSDIVGSTAYFARFGDATGRQLHQLHFDLLGKAAADAQGRIVDAVGDGVFCVFPDVEAGVRGIVEFQQAMARENAARAREHQLAVRIGLHWGSVLTDGAMVTGDSVHVAARVARAAEPGGVCLTRGVFLELGPGQRLHCHPIGTRELKGVAQPVELLELDWRDPAAFPRRVLIEETGEQIALPQKDIVSFGRLHEPDGARANDIVLQHPDPALTRQISRWHFELRRGPDGLRLRTLSDGLTTIDGRTVGKGADVPVRSGTRIGVANILTLRLTDLAHAAADDEDSRTMIRPDSVF